MRGFMRAQVKGEKKSLPGVRLRIIDRRKMSGSR